MTIRKVGGIHFARIGRVQLSFCLCRAKPASRADRLAASERAADATIVLLIVAAVVAFFV